MNVSALSCITTLFSLTFPFHTDCFFMRLRPARWKKSPLLRASSNYNPNDHETQEEFDRRMNMVRQIQSAFYQESNLNESDRNGLQKWLDVDHENEPTIIQQLPLWRVQWTELPGYQNVLNVHVPHYTHMFRKLLFQHSPPWYFGHVYLHDGSKNLGNAEYNLPEWINHDNGTTTISKVDESYCPLIGTLMQVTDYTIQEDGRLTMIVQGVGRFRILEAIQQVPYAVAKVQRLPDFECWQQYVEPLVGKSGAATNDDLTTAVTAAAKAVAVQEEELLRELSYRTTRLSKDTPVFQVSPLSNVNGTASIENVSIRHNLATRFMTTLQNQANALASDEVLFAASTLPLPHLSLMDAQVAACEREVWVELDRMIQLLGKIQPGVVIPVPSQLLGLLPVTGMDWPTGFQLESYADKLETDEAGIGTHSRSPFVRLSRRYPQYPVLKRASRFSFAVWMIVYTISFDNQGVDKEELLRTDGIRERLEKALRQLQRLNETLKIMAQ